MKIKFIKEYRGVEFVDRSETVYRSGNVVDIDDNSQTLTESAQWLINNGFAEEVKESGWWKPKYCEKYFYIGHDGSVYHCVWINDVTDNARLKLGSVFKTEEAAIRCRDYWEAVVTVRQDEGIVCLEEICERHDLNDDGNYCVYTVGSDSDLKELVVLDSGDCITASSIWFGDEKHARASLEKHPDEWKTIANYDWSRE